MVKKQDNIFKNDPVAAHNCQLSIVNSAKPFKHQLILLSPGGFLYSFYLTNAGNIHSEKIFSRLLVSVRRFGHKIRWSDKKLNGIYTKFFSFPPLSPGESCGIMSPNDEIGGG